MSACNLYTDRAPRELVLETQLVHLVEYIGDRQECDYGAVIRQQNGMSYFVPFGSGGPLGLLDSEIGGSEVRAIPKEGEE